MNKFQMTVLIAALANLALLLFFPPFDSQPLGRMGSGSFESFYPTFNAPPNVRINTGLLYLELFALLVNGVLVWLLLQDTREEPYRPRMRWQSVLQWLVVADLLLILLFPPFETQALAARIGDRTFDGFKFALSGNVQTGIFLPLLFLELLLLALNATVLWLAFGLVARSDAVTGGNPREAPAPPVPAASAGTGLEAGQVGRSGHDRRAREEPHYSGPERRRRGDRRKHR